MDRYNGILPVYKSVGITSHDLIDRLRGIVGQKRIGHTGTLDPQADGLMLICLGRATKLTQFFTEWDKGYRAKITFGQSSDTMDGAGIMSDPAGVPALDRNQIETVLRRFTGKIIQKVPLYSAVKVGGRELHKYARAGVAVESPEREVEVYAIDLLNIELPSITIHVRCSKGTYIRVLADDIGRQVGCGIETSTNFPFACGSQATRAVLSATSGRITVAPVTSVEVSSPEQVLADLGIDDGVPKLLEEFSGELTLLRNFF